MDIGYEKEPFQSISIKQSVADKFRTFCKRQGTSQSMTLLAMLEFFQMQGINPDEQLGPHMQTLEQRLKKRINALIAIIKDIEKNQTKPTAAMLHALFQAADANQPKLREKKEHPPSQPKFREQPLHKPKL